jgi:hypothetical protein
MSWMDGSLPRSVLIGPAKRREQVRIGCVGSHHSRPGAGGRADPGADRLWGQAGLGWREPWSRAVWVRSAAPTSPIARRSLAGGNRIGWRHPPHWDATLNDMQSGCGACSGCLRRVRLKESLERSERLPTRVGRRPPRGSTRSWVGNPGGDRARLASPWSPKSTPIAPGFPHRRHQANAPTESAGSKGCLLRRNMQPPGTPPVGGFSGLPSRDLPPARARGVAEIGWVRSQNRGEGVGDLRESQESALPGPGRASEGDSVLRGPSQTRLRDRSGFGLEGAVGGGQPGQRDGPPPPRATPLPESKRSPRGLQCSRGHPRRQGTFSSPSRQGSPRGDKAGRRQ